MTLTKSVKDTTNKIVTQKLKANMEGNNETFKQSTETEKSRGKDEAVKSSSAVVVEDSPKKGTKVKVTRNNSDEYESPTKKCKRESTQKIDAPIQSDAQPTWKIVRIGMRGTDGRELAGGEKSIPRKTRRQGVRLVIDENGGGVTSLKSVNKKKAASQSEPDSTFSPGLNSYAKSVTDDDESDAKENEHLEKANELDDSKMKDSSSSMGWMKSISLKVLNTLSFGLFSATSKELTHSDFAITHHAQFDTEDIPIKEILEEQDFNEYRLSGGAERDKNQPKESRAVSLAVVNTYDKLESLLSSTPGEKVCYGDLGENFLIDGPRSLVDAIRMDTDDESSNDSQYGKITKNQLKLGMKLNLGTKGAMIEICIVNNPCTRLGNVPWSERAKKFVGGMYVHPTMKKYGWWWSPKLPLYDGTHPGGRGLLCRVLKEGEVYENDVVTIVESDP